MEYTALKCKHCKREFILISTELLSIKINCVIQCPYCHSPKVQVEKAADNLKDCMQERCYRRINGAIRELK